MAQNILSGKTGSVSVGATSYSFGKWSADLKTKLPDTSNWISAPYRTRVSGLTDATVNISGPYDQSNMPFTSGSSYTFILGWTNSVNLTIPCIIESIKADNDVDGNPTIAITAQSTGAFTAAIT